MATPLAALMLLTGIAVCGVGEMADVHDLGEYAVYGVRDEMELEHSAIGVTTISREQIAATGAGDMVEVLERMAGVQFRSYSGHSGGAEVSLRGFGENSGLRVLILVDGQKLNRPDMGALDWGSIAIGSVERVEVMWGPQTALYGNHAVGGVIRITTRGQAETASLSTQVSAGSHGYMSGRFHWQQDLAGISASLGGGYQEAAGWRANSEQSGQHWNLKLRREWGKREADGGWDRIGMEGSLGYFAGEHSYPGPLSRQQFLANPRQSEGRQQWSETELWRAAGRVEWRPLRTLLVAMDGGHTRRDLNWDLSGIHAWSRMHGVSYAPELRMRAGVSTLSIGMEFAGDRLDFDRYAEAGRSTRLGSAQLQRQSAAAFLHLSSDLTRRWKWHATLRRVSNRIRADNTEWYFFDPGRVNPDLSFVARRTDESGWAAALGTTYAFAPGKRLWARVDRLYRQPSLDEIAAYQGHPLTAPFNEELRAERGWNLEAGINWQQGAAEFHATVYQMAMDQEIVFDYQSGLNQNLADTLRRGFDIEAAWASTLLRIHIRYSRTHAQFRDGPYAGKDLYLVPRQQVHLGVRWQVHEMLSLQGYYRWQSAQWEGNDLRNQHRRMPAYGLWDAVLRWQIRPRWSGFAALDNAFDKRYAAVVYAGAFYPGSGRALRVGTEFEF